MPRAAYHGAGAGTGTVKTPRMGGFVEVRIALAIRLMSTRAVSRRAVAALFLRRQHLTSPRSKRLTARSLLAFVEDVGGLQLDSINVVERGHYLTLWSRFGPYERRTVERIAYRRRQLFEYWAHAACLVSASHFPAWRRVMLDYSVRNRNWGQWLQTNRRVLRAVLEAIATNGPMGSADFEHRRASEAEEAGGTGSPPPTPSTISG